MLVFMLAAVLVVGVNGYAQSTWYVDDDAPSDPGAGDPTVSDPSENGSAAHPFDAIQEGIDAAINGDTVMVRDGTYTGMGNRDLDFGGRLITVRSANGAAACVIDCESAGRGFYFHNGETAAAVVRGFTITNGHGSDNGGGMYNDNSSPTVTHCIFIGNTADMHGGGLCNREYSSPMVTQCTFSGNDANFGGGMENFGSSPTVTDCTFIGNTAQAHGGGMCNGESSTTVTQCTFSGNMAWDLGGGICSWFSSSQTVTQCTFSRNEANFGGGICNYYSSPTVTNCILWGDTPEEIYNYDPNSAPTVTYSDVQGGTGEPWFGAGCLDADPLLADADGLDDTFGTEDDNLRLAGGSPCIDAGVNAAVPPGLTTDLDGKPRISHGTVDMGAYERQDEDGDGVIDGSDVCPGFDDNADGDSDGVPDGCDDCPDTPGCAVVDADGCTSDSDADGVVDGCDDCADTPNCATNIDANGCAIDSDGDGSPDGCPPAEQEPQGCCGATGPVAPLGLAIGMLLLSRFTGYRTTRRRR